jgi:ketosteroid isomerase-like protein
MSAVLEQTAEAVVQRHWAALFAHDLEALLRDYAEDAVMLISIAPAPIRGLAGLRAFWEMALQLWTPEVIRQFKMDAQLAAGDIVFATWTVGETIPLGTDTFIVRDGKIAVQTAAALMRQP